MEAQADDDRALAPSDPAVEALAELVAQAADAALGRVGADPATPLESCVYEAMAEVLHRVEFALAPDASPCDAARSLPEVVGSAVGRAWVWITVSRIVERRFGRRRAHVERVGRGARAGAEASAAFASASASASASVFASSVRAERERPPSSDRAPVPQEDVWLRARPASERLLAALGLGEGIALASAPVALGGGAAAADALAVLCASAARAGVSPEALAIAARRLPGGPCPDPAALAMWVASDQPAGARPTIATSTAPAASTAIAAPAAPAIAVTTASCAAAEALAGHVAGCTCCRRAALSAVLGPYASSHAVKLAAARARLRLLEGRIPGAGAARGASPSDAPHSARPRSAAQRGWRGRAARAWGAIARGGPERESAVRISLAVLALLLAPAVGERVGDWLGAWRGTLAGAAALARADAAERALGDDASSAPYASPGAHERGEAGALIVSAAHGMGRPDPVDGAFVALEPGEALWPGDVILAGAAGGRVTLRGHGALWLGPGALCQVHSGDGPVGVLELRRGEAHFAAERGAAPLRLLVGTASCEVERGAIRVTRGPGAAVLEAVTFGQRLDTAEGAAWLAPGETRSLPSS